MDPATVRHPQYGIGTVTAKRKGGIEWQIQFADGTLIWSRFDQVEIIVEKHISGELLTNGKREASNFTDRLIIEAMRLGIVPDTGVSIYTVGRDEEVTLLQDWLHSPIDMGHSLIGTYGTGKTHLLRYLYQYALQNGYAVSFVEVDPLESPFSNPKMVYSQLVASLRWISQGEVYGFRELVSKGLSMRVFNNHPYFSYLGSPVSEPIWHWIEARSIRTLRPPKVDWIYRNPPALYPFSTSANIYTYLISSLSWLARHPSIGLKGMLVIFDEAESVWQRSGVYGRERAVNFLDALIKTAYEDSIMFHPPSATRMTYAKDASNIPFAYKPTSGLKVLLAFTDTENSYGSKEIERLPETLLKNLDESSLLELVDRLISLYERAYKVDLHAYRSEVQNNVLKERSSTRLHIKGLVELLDIRRYQSKLASTSL